LERGTEFPLTLVSAPAGFGKTTLLAEWLVERRMPCAWLALEVRDNEPMRFCSYLLAALQQVHPALGVAARALFDPPYAVAVARVIAVLANELIATRVEDFTLVLDDYHVIELDAIQQGMAFLLDHLPPQMHLVLATRVDPPLPLARLRARGQLFEVRAAD